MTASRDNVITLDDGRTLSYAEHGDLQGRPVLWLHGAASSRLEGEFFEDGASRRGLRIISTDRPGCGGSSPRPGFTYLSYVPDLLELQDQLGIAACPVGGLSNGGVFALAAGYAQPDRFPAVISVNATSPVADRAARAALPLSTRAAYLLMRLAPGWVVRQTLARDPGADGPAAAAAAEARRQPSSGYLRQEILIACRPWGFDHRSLTQPVEIVTGDRDGGFAYARVLATELPEGKLTVFAGGHTGVAVEPGNGAVLDALDRAAAYPSCALSA